MLAETGGVAAQLRWSPVQGPTPWHDNMSTATTLLSRQNAQRHQTVDNVAVLVEGRRALAGFAVAVAVVCVIAIVL